MSHELVWGAGYGNIEQVKRKLDSGDNINGCYGYFNALMFASWNGHENVVRLLLSRGANVNLTGWVTCTALLNACDQGHLSVVEILLKSGANHFSQKTNSDTALHRACANGHLAVVELLLRHGASHTCRNHAGKIPIEMCEDSAKRAQIQMAVDTLTAAPLPASPASQVEQLRVQVAGLTAERDSLQSQLNDQTREKDGIAAQLAQVAAEQSTANNQRDAVVADRDAIDAKLSVVTTERDQLRTQLDATVADRTAINTQLTARTAERDRLQALLDAAVAERDQVRAQMLATSAAPAADVCPFQRYQPHCFVPGIVPVGSGPGLYNVEPSSPLFNHARLLCRTGGIWLMMQREVHGFRLVGVQAVVPPAYLLAGYTNQQERMNVLRSAGGAHFNFNTADEFNAQQLRILNTLRDSFQERAPGSGERGVNTVHCFHGPRREHLESICSTGLVAVGGMDDGFFGVGCYTTLNIEYAARYAFGEFDEDEQGRPKGPRSSPDGLYPVIMLAATVGMAYPVTREADYEPYAQRSKFLGRALKRGFDAHVVCVNQMAGFQAVGREQCEYVELVIDQQAQLLPLAVLWFEKV